MKLNKEKTIYNEKDKDEINDISKRRSEIIVSKNVKIRSPW